MRLYLVRHGQTSWNIEGLAQGHTDIPLDETGLGQAEAVGEAFRGIPLDGIISSDLQRAWQTANAISVTTGAPVERRREVRERGFGDWEGIDFRELAAKSLEVSLNEGISLSHVRPPRGESFADVWERVAPVLEELENTDARIAIVSHGGTCGILAARLLRGTVETARSFRFGNTAITEFERRGDGYYTLLRYSDSQHLGARHPIAGSVDGTHR